MKELSIEEKAKRYDEAIAHAKMLLKTIGNATLGNLVLKNEFKNMFPELKESDDEMIRKALIHYMKDYSDGTGLIHAAYGVSRNDAIAWLEKQGEKGTNGKNREIPFADKVEPKFKVGDFIVNDYCMGRIVEITNDAYLLDTEQGIPFSCHSTRLWDIAKDAKDGDVLAVEPIEDYQYPFVAICKEHGLDFFNSYCFIGFDGKFYEADTGHSTEKIHPATKEQRDQLEKAMADAGYTFDFEKKKLRKIEQKLAENKGMNIVEEDMTPFQKKVFCIIDTAIEEEQGLKQVCDELLALASNEIKQKPAWSEEDDDNLSWLVEMLLGFDGNDIECYKDKKFIDKCKEVCKWLKAIKDRTFPQPKQEWSEEDECMLSRFFNCIGHYYADNFITKEQQTLMEDWLKSRIPQIDVTDEELAEAKKEAYNEALGKIEYHNGEPTFDDGWSAAIWYLKKRNGRLQSTWKPSEEQIEILDMVLTNESMDDNVARILRELREQLKKLREG